MQQTTLANKIEKNKKLLQEWRREAQSRNNIWKENWKSHQTHVEAKEKNVTNNYEENWKKHKAFVRREKEKKQQTTLAKKIEKIIKILNI